MKQAFNQNYFAGTYWKLDHIVIIIYPAYKCVNKLSILFIIIILGHMTFIVIILGHMTFIVTILGHMTWIFSLQVIIISVIIVIVALLVYTVGYFIAQCFAKRRIQNTGGYGALNERVSL